MEGQSLELWEAQVQDVARAFAYPPTPDIARAVGRRVVVARRPSVLTPTRPRVRLAWAVVALLIALVALMTVPQVRAAVLEFLQIGAIRIFFSQPTPTLTPGPSPFEGEGMVEGPVTATPGDTLAPSPSEGEESETDASRFSILNLSGRTTLEDAELRAGVPVKLPTYPADLGPPDRVFYQEVAGPMVVLVWLEPGSADQVRLSLYILALEGGAFGGKFDWENVEPATVNGDTAYWVQGWHILQFFDARGRPLYEMARLVEGNVLIWVEGDVTYRLETALSLEEAVRIAESLR
ncbi:MAG: hypothetical protein AB1791_15965 [Chloroflexota bacterium]